MINANQIPAKINKICFVLYYCSNPFCYRNASSVYLSPVYARPEGPDPIFTAVEDAKKLFHFLIIYPGIQAQFLISNKIKI